MSTISVNQFRDNLRYYADLVTKDHEPVTVTRRNGEAFVVLSAQDWKSIEETLYVLENQSIMKQIQDSAVTHQKGHGRRLSPKESDEIDNI